MAFLKMKVMAAKKMTMNVVNAHAAGIDVGSRSHYVAVGQGADQVKEFSVYSRDHQLMIEWLRAHQVVTIAMESTGNYWQTLFAALQDAGFEVLLVNGRHTQNVRGKTDVKDCQWLQQLHSLGVLRGSFLPSAAVDQMRTLQRHRNWLIEQCAALSNKMQKSMRLMNIRLDIALSDILGKSGRSIIEAIVNGERDGQQLALLVNRHVKKSPQQIADALTGNWKPELLFELQDCYELYQVYEQRIARTDRELEALLKQLKPTATAPAPVLKRKRSYRNQQQFDVALLSYRYLGVSLFDIDGISHATVMSFLTEIGLDIYKFPTAKAFTHWLRLAPNNKITGSRVVSSRTPKGKHPFALVLRNAANSIGLSKTGTLKSFFARIAFKKGRAAAITATARKLAVIIWNMVSRQQCYTPITEDRYAQKIRVSVLSNIKKKLQKHNLSIPDLQAVMTS